MAADWNQPTLTTAYTTHHDNLKDRDVDAYTLAEAPTNPPTGAIRYNRSGNKFQEWSGAAWVDKVIALAGGGTGGIDAASARTSLGLGSMAVQNSNAVSITGGSASGLTSLGVSGNSVLSGRLDVGSTATDAIDVAGGITAGSGNVGIIDTTGKIPALSSTYFASLTALGAWTFSSPLTITGTNVTVSNTDPQFISFESDAAADEKFYRNIAVAGDLLIGQPVNDAFTVGGTAPIILRRTGNAIVSIDISSPLISSTVTFNNGITATGDLNFGCGAANQILLAPAGSLGFRVLNNTAVFYDDATLAPSFQFSVTSSTTFLSVFGKALGTGAIAGPFVGVGRNSSGGGAPGVLKLTAKDGTIYMLWVDSTGKFRIGTTAPTETGTADTTGTVVGTQT